MQTIALVNLTPPISEGHNQYLDNTWVPQGGAGNNGWCFLPEGSAWSFSMVWTPGKQPNPVPVAGQFVVESTNDAVCQPIDTAVNPVADANLNIFIARDDFGNTMTCSGQANESTQMVNFNYVFYRQRPAPMRWVRVNLRNGAVGCNAQIVSLWFHATGLRDA